MDSCPKCGRKTSGYYLCQYCGHPTLVRRKETPPGRTTLAKDTGKEIVVVRPLLWSTIAGLFACFAIIVFVILALTGWSTRSDFLSWLGLGVGLLLFSIFFIGFTTKVTLDNILGNITIQQYIWPWSYNTRHIPKKEAQGVLTEIDERTSGVPGSIDIPTYNVLIRVAGREKATKISTTGKRQTTYLADRIHNFIYFE